MTVISELERLREQIERLEAENRELKNKLARAKDPTPVERPSIERCKRMAADACMSIERCDRGWRFRMGWQVCQRIFRRLRDLWEFLLQDEWLIEDLGGFYSPEVLNHKKVKVAPKLPKRNPSLLPNFGFNDWVGDRFASLFNRQPVVQSGVP